MRRKDVQKNAGSGNAAEFPTRRPPEVQNRGRTPEVRVREDVETRDWEKMAIGKELLQGLVESSSSSSSSRAESREKIEILHKWE